jgi:two-component system, response regulator PdtaR
MNMLFGKRERVINRILIVEDEPLVAFDNEHFLREAGYEIVGTVDTHEDAARILKEQDVDLVLADLRLRGEGDGAGVARLATARGIPVLIASGHAPPEDEGLAVGYLSKPYTDKMLVSALAALERHLSGKRVRRLPPGLQLFQRAGNAA